MFLAYARNNAANARLCRKIRSHLWQHEQWAPLDGLPTLAETMKDAAALAAPVEVVERVIKEDEEQRLY